MHERRIIQIGPPGSVYANPVNGAAARLLGHRNVHRGNIEGTKSTPRLLWLDGGIALAIDGRADADMEVDWTIDPEAIRLVDSSDAAQDAIRASVEVRHVIGRTTQLGLRCGQGRLWVSVPSDRPLPESVAVHLPIEAIRWWKRS
jgi:molybdate/tungstate transport system ATP-binding protein